MLPWKSARVWSPAPSRGTGCAAAKSRAPPRRPIAPSSRAASRDQSTEWPRTVAAGGRGGALTSAWPGSAATPWQALESTRNLSSACTDDRSVGVMVTAHTPVPAAKRGGGGSVQGKGGPRRARNAGCCARGRACDVPCAARPQPASSRLHQVPACVARGHAAASSCRGVRRDGREQTDAQWAGGFRRDQTCAGWWS